MVPKFALLLALCATSLSEDDKKWVWGDNSRAASNSRLNVDREGRYEVFENDGPFRPSQPYLDQADYQPELNHIHRPGGIYGGVPHGGVPSGNYGHGHPHYPNDVGPGQPEILTGPIPSWVREGPYKNYDKCKCTEKFNCNSPGISYGHCDVGKQYCCYATNKHDQIGGPLPSRPHHSIENGILAGPGGPVDVPRPAYTRPGGFRPRPGAGFGLGGGGHGEYGPINNRPVHSPENGILVGPGGPFDRPYGGRPGYGGNFGFGRSAKGN